MGGAERLVLLYAQSLDKKKYTVRVSSTNGGGDLCSQFQKANIDAHIVDRASLGGRRNAYYKLVEIAEEFQPDIIHSHLFGGDLLAYFLKKRMPRVTWISTVHNVRTQESWIRRKVWRTLFRKTDRIIAVAKEVAAFLKKDYRFAAEKVVMIPNGVPLKEWLAIPDADVLSQKTIRLATIGRLEEQKGHTYLLDALALVPKNIAWTLDIFGDGSLRTSLQKQADQLGLADQITWHGVNNSLEKAYASIDVVLQPSLWEGMSLVVMEAMAAGRLVIASKPAAANLVKNGKTGMVIVAKDATALAQAIEDAARKKKTMKRMAASGRAYAKEHFSAKAHMAKIERLYKR